MAPSSLGSERLPAVPEGEDAAHDTEGEGEADLSMSFAEEDLVALSKSTGHIEAPTLHARFASYQAPAPRGGEDVRRSLDWMQDMEDESRPKTKMMVIEVSSHVSRHVLHGLKFDTDARSFFPSAQRLETKPLCLCW